MGIDEYLGREHPYPVPAVRFFTWSRNTISIGRNQNPEKRLDLGLCRRNGVDVVQRPTGGKEILHGRDLCFSVIWPVREGETILEARKLFGLINDIIVAALGRMGIRSTWNKELGRRGANAGPCFAQVDRGEIAVEGRKLVASAQRVSGGAVLQQSSMSLSKPEIDLSLYLRRSDRRSIRRMLESNAAFFDELVAETMSPASIVEVFKGEFERFLGRGSRSFEKDLEEISGGILRTVKYEIS